MKKGGARSKTQKKSSLSKKKVPLLTMRKRNTKSKNNLKNIIRNMEHEEENPFEYLKNACDFFDRISSKVNNLLVKNYSHNTHEKLSIIASIVASKIADTLKTHSHLLKKTTNSFNEMNIDTEVKHAIKVIYDNLMNEDFALENPIDYIEEFKKNLDELISLYNIAETNGDTELEIQLVLFASFLQDDIKEAIQLSKTSLHSKNNMNVNSNLNMKSVSSKKSKSSASSASSATSIDDLTDLFSSVLTKSFGKA
jgi:hypothetical protein